MLSLTRMGLPANRHPDRIGVRGRQNPQRDPRCSDRSARRNVTSRNAPSASISCVATAFPFTNNSTGTFRELPMRARSTSQYGF